jgi:tetratricopeptide (TPR) repeat protein
LGHSLGYNRHVTGKTTEAYSRSDVVRILGIDSSQLKRWERQGLYDPLTSFEFTNLRELRNLKRLYARVSRHRRGERVGGLLRDIRRMGVSRPLLDVNYVWDAPGIVVQDSGGRWVRPETQQLVFSFGPLPPVRAKAVSIPSRPVNDECIRRAEECFQRGLALEECGGSSEEAEKAYRAAVEFNPHAAGAWVNLGTLRFRDGELKTAEEHYRRALSISHDYALAHFNLANICEETGRLREGLEHYEQAIRIHPSYADAHYNLALVAERTGEPMRAVKHWQTYLRLDPNSPWAGIARQQLDSLLQVKPGGGKRP